MVPIYEIIDFTKNRYLLSRAVMKRAREINFIGDDELNDENKKIASLALMQILRNDIKYIIQKDEKPKKV